MKERTQDVPVHEEGETSSIGGTWPPESASHRRRKAIYDRVVKDYQTFACFYQQFLYNTRGLSEKEFKNGKLIPPTRIQFRAIIETNIIRDHVVNSAIADYIEAIIPLESGNFGTDAALVYLGSNSKIRESNLHDLDIIRSNIETASKFDRRDLDTIFSRPNTNGYEIGILKNRNESVTSQISKLYERFDWGMEDVRKMLSNPNNILCIARLEDRIVSSGIAELAEVEIDNVRFRMAEITEAATLDGHYKQGLYTAVSARLLVELARMSESGSLGGNLDLVFGECNGLSLGVLKVAKIQGRTFATEVGARYGYPKSGILRQQVPINGAERHAEYNDLIPAYLTTSKLHEYYGGNLNV